MRVIKPTENWQTVIDAGPDTEYQLVANAAYTGVGNWYPRRGGWTLDAQNATITFTVPAGASSVVKIAQPGISIKNAKLQVTEAGSYDMFRIQASTASVMFCTLIGPPIATFVMIDTGAVHAMLMRNTVPATNSVSIYVSADSAVVQGNTLAGSVGEVPIRVDSDTNGHYPEGVIVTRNTVRTLGGANQKGAVEWRYAGPNCQHTLNSQNDYVRVGQGVGMKTAGQSVAGLAVRNNTWTGMKTVLCNLLLESGVVVAVQNNYNAGTHPPITLGSPLNLTVDRSGLYDPAKKTDQMVITGG